MADLFANFATLEFKQVAMWIIGAILIYLAIKKEMEQNHCCSRRLVKGEFIHEGVKCTSISSPSMTGKSTW